MQTKVSFAAALGAVWLSLAGPALAAETIILRADSWCPYNCEPTSAKPGYIVEIAKAVFEPKGITVDYALMPWQRAVEETRAGRVHGAVGASAVDAEDLIMPKESLGMDQSALAHAKDKPFSWAGASSLAGHRLGGVQGYEYKDELQAYIDANKGNPDAIDFLTGDDVTQKNVAKLLAGRLDLVLDNTQVLRYAIAQAKAQDKLVTTPILDATPLSIAFTKAKPEGQKYADMLDAGVKELRASGQLKKILDSYGLEDWAK